MLSVIVVRRDQKRCGSVASWYLAFPLLDLNSNLRFFKGVMRENEKKHAMDDEDEQSDVKCFPCTLAPDTNYSVQGGGSSDGM